MNEEIIEFGKRVIHETFVKWKSYENQYNFWNYGFGVFYSPIYYKPDLMIIGYNVGGTEKDFDESESLIIPEKHEYFTCNYKLARTQKYIWGKLNKIDSLKRSVKLNLNFFRSKNIAQWQTVNKEIRKEVEIFCAEKVKEIICNIQPKLILVEGMKTYDELFHKVFNVLLINSETIKRNKRRIFTKSVYDNKDILGIIHPSGSRLSSQDFEIIISSLQNAINF